MVCIDPSFRRRVLCCPSYGLVQVLWQNVASLSVWEWGLALLLGLPSALVLLTLTLPVNTLTPL